MEATGHAQHVQGVTASANVWRIDSLPLGSHASAREAFAGGDGRLASGTSVERPGLSLQVIRRA
jgi:hypothetical protein